MPRKPDCTLCFGSYCSSCGTLTCDYGLCDECSNKDDYDDEDDGGLMHYIDAALAVPCPVCAAAPGDACLGQDIDAGRTYVRDLPHEQRYDAAQGLLSADLLKAEEDTA